MPPRYSYRSAAGSNGDRTSYFQLYTLDVITNAEEGSVGTSTLHADDPDGTLDIAGHQKITITEDLATGSNTVTYVGFTGNREISRGQEGDQYRVSAGAVWDIQVQDVNTLLSRRVFRSGEADRPEETDVARVNWAMTMAATNEIQDTSFIAQVNPVDMDEADYRGQTLFNVLDDCAQQSGKNWFVWYNETSTQFGLWYDFAAASNWTSPLRLSNYLSDLTGVIANPNTAFTYPLSEDTKLTKDPSRVYSLAYVAYQGGATYAENGATASNFVRRDAVMPAVNVKTKAKAQARAQRYINDLATEEDVVRTSVWLPAERVNYIKAGQRIQIRASHLPGYEDWTWVRCVNKETEHVGESLEVGYKVTLELVSPVAAEVTPTGQTPYGILYVGNGPRQTEFGADILYYSRPGDNPGPGFHYRPTTSNLTVLQDTTPPGGNGSYYGFRVNGNGLINVTAMTTSYGICVEGITYTWTFAIRKNGVIVESQSGIFAAAVGQNLKAQGWDPTITKTGLVVANGDVITATLSSSPTNPLFFRAPRGTGQNGERLEITGGSV